MALPNPDEFPDQGDVAVLDGPDPTEFPDQQQGNIDLANRPVVQNPDGTVSTEKSISIGTDQGEVLIPTVVNGKVVTKDEAIKHYRDTGEHLGIFKTPADATAYAKQLHNVRELERQNSAKPSGPDPSAFPDQKPQSIGGPWGKVLDYLDLQKEAQAPEERSKGAKVLTGLGQMAQGFVPHSLEEAKQMATLPMPARDTAELEQKNEQWRQLVAGEHGLEAQVATIGGTAIQALPIAHLPFKIGAEALRAVPKADLELVNRIRVAKATPPELPDYATTQYDPVIARSVQAQAALPDVLAAQEAAAVMPEVAREATGPVVETAIDKAMRLTGQPARTAAEIAMDVEPAVPELLIQKQSAERLKARGFTQDQINEMTPEAKQKALTAKASDSELARTEFNRASLTDKGEVLMGDTHNDIANRAETEGKNVINRGYVDRTTGEYLTLMEKTRQEMARQAATKTATVTPDEATTAVAESPEAAAPGEIAPGQEQPATRRPYGVGQPADSSPGASGGPGVGISEARTEAELGPGSVVPGVGAELGEGFKFGRDWINKGGDPRLPIRRSVRAINSGASDVGIVHAELDRLRSFRNAASDALDKDPGNPALQQAFQVADDAQRSWRKELQPVLTKASKELREAHAASLPVVDPATYQGLADLMDEHFQGKRVITPEMRTKLSKAAKGVKEAQTVAGTEMGNIEKTLENNVTRRGKRVMTDTELDADLRNVVEKQFKDCVLSIGG